MAIVAELSYDDILNGTFPETSHTRHWQQTAVQAVEQLPRLHAGDRLDKALHLVLSNAVTLNPDGTATVRSGGRP